MSVARGGKVSPEARARGKRLRDARLAAGLEVPEIAEALGVRAMTVYRWEWGSSAFHVDDAPRIAEAYGIRAGYLVAGEPPVRARRSA